MDAQLETLREQNLALLQRLRQGQVNCHQIIDSIQSKDGTATSLAQSTGPVSTQDVSSSEQEVDVLTGSEAGNATRARESLRSKHRPLIQGTESVNAYFDTSNVNLEQSSGVLPDTPTSRKFASRTATPNRTTPKSILKHRKLIDDNVKVTSGLTTPRHMSRRGRS